MAEERAGGALNNVAVGHNQQTHFEKYSPSQFRNNIAPLHHHHKLHQHRRQHRKWVTGGPGMQAVFLDTDMNNNNKSCGTGVFLPQITPHTKTKKPACSPVLLPSRVVQALNLNVHDLVTPRKEINELSSKKNREDAMETSNIFSEKECLLPDIFLPKEWTY